MSVRHFPELKEKLELAESTRFRGGSNNNLPLSYAYCAAVALLLPFSVCLVPLPPALAGATPAQSKAVSSLADASLNRGVQQYQHNSYKEAEIELRRSISENPTNPAAHYYLANSLVHMNRHDEAVEEFKRSYRLDPFGPTSGYCRKALKAYAERAAGASSEKSAVGADDFDVDAPSSMMRYAQKPATAIPPQEKFEALHRQVEREKIRHQQTADSYGRAMRKSGEGESLTIRQNARDDIDQILHGTRGGLPWVQQAAEARAAEVQHNADELEKIARERALERADEYKSVSKAKGRALDETVTNLERQLVTKTLPGTPSLRHEGTDLFVRSYSPSLKQSPYPSAHAAVARVNPAHIIPAGDEVTGDQAKQDVLSPVPVHVIKGEVLK